MNNGWVKLHRKILDNEFLKYDPTSFRVFIGLLLLADKDSGAWSGGRFQLANYLVLNPNTLYSSLKRLENAKIITLNSNNKYTTISIVNWAKYQGDVNTKRQQPINNGSTTDQHSNKNKEYIYNKTEKKIISLFPEIEIILRRYCERFKINKIARQTENIRAARDLLQGYGLDKVLKAIDVAYEVRVDQYAPMITSLIKLKEKYPDLQAYYKRKYGDKDRAKKNINKDVGVVRNSLGRIVN